MKSTERVGGCYLALRRYLDTVDHSDGAGERLTEARRYVRGYEQMLQHAHASDLLSVILRGESLFASAHAALEEGLPEQAKLGFETLLALAPLHHPSRAHLGAAWMAIGDRVEALACVQHALELAPSYLPAQKHLVLLGEPS